MARILVAEDDPRVLAMVRQRLQIGGFQILEAGDPQEAWRSLIEDGADAALIDISLRGEADGWRLIGSVRDDGRFARLPIVVMTGTPRTEIEDKARSLDCSFLAKPFLPDDMIASLRQAMGGALQQVGVTILLAALRIEGTVHLTSEHSRFSDAWEVLMRDERSFIPVTGVTVSMPDGSNHSEVPFLQVRKADILAVYPADA
ncbi:MAG TPA: response regulator [Actinomycetota bacterium]|nr:response regulator [Actinomycetota bacterium]